MVPTYNERENIAPLLERLGKVALEGLHVLFVDDSSPDGTADVVREAMKGNESVHVLIREGKKGIGSAHIEGFARALETLSPDVLIEMDADLQHPPEKIPDLVAAIANGADVAVASRKVEGGGTEGWSLWRRGVSKGANVMAKVVLGLGVNDSTSGFRALSSRATRVLVDSELPSQSYFFQVASLYLLKKRGMKMVEVPFRFQARKAGKSKMGISEIVGFLLGVWKLRLFGV
ncbi:MAG: polyprenol monophosphomannose synthase [Nitrososphaerales archaeon]|nr:polyprenol monophosphomannose synthase [Nitrososphaerales archaeon]